MDKVDQIGRCIPSALKATQRASKCSWFLACSSCFPVWPFAELLDEGCIFIEFYVMHALRCVAECEVSERIPIVQYLGTWADHSRYCQRCEPSNATTQCTTEACKTCFHAAKENLTTESSCWHTWRHAEYPNKSWFNNSNCKFVLSETNSLPGLTAGKERQF